MSTETLEKVTTTTEVDFLPLNGTDHIEFYVGNAKQSAYYYQSAWGYELIAYAGPETGVRDRASYVLKQGKIVLVLTSSILPDSEIAQHHAKHGDGVKVLALWVDDARKSYEATTSRGAKGVMEPQVFTDEHGEVVISAIQTYGETIHKFVERRNYKGTFMPGFMPSLYHLYFVFTHVLAAFFMFALIRELGLGRFPALLGGLCYSLGGFVGVVPWPHMLESTVWLPLQFLLLLRALHSSRSRPALVYAALAGLALGMSILAGGLHIVMMQAIVLVTATAYDALQNRAGWQRATMVAALIVVIGLGAGAIQLLPSAEYSARAIRFVSGTSLPATQKIPLAYLVDSIHPHTILSYVFFSWNFQGKLGPGEALSPYLGIFPLLLAVVGVWKCRDRQWVRYSAGLAVAAFLFSLGTSSLLYGLIYALVPLLWMAREASRFLYITHFALVILAAYGAQTVFCRKETSICWVPLERILLWLALAAAVVLGIPYLYGQPELRSWTEWSLLFIISTYPLFRYVVGSGTSAIARFLVVAFIVLDLHSFNGVASNKIEAARTSGDQLERLVSMRGAADFLKHQPGLFRVQVVADPALNIGDAYGIETLNGGAVTLAANYMELTGRGGPGIDLLNVRYFVKPASAPDPNPLYADANWKVFANPSGYPRAWVENDAAAAIDIQEHSARHTAVKLSTASGGMFVVSELFYPGWEARVNGKPELISEVHGGLRGIPVPPGQSQITVEYAPTSVKLGATLSALTFAFTLVAATICLKR